MASQEPGTRNQEPVPGLFSHARVWRVIAAAAAWIALFTVGMCRLDVCSPDAAVYEGICREIMANTTEGRQALVGSIWWPPLPVLLRLPLAAVLGDLGVPVASVAVSAFFGTAILLLLEHMLRYGRLGWVRFVVIVLVALNPVFLRYSADGSNVTTAGFFVMLCAYGLGVWVTGRQLKSLVFLGFGSGMLVWTSPEGTLWLVAVFVLLAVDLVIHQFEPRQREAVLFLTLLPPLYMAALWLLLDWLIMGDALCFLRSLLDTGFRGGAGVAPLRAGGFEKTALILTTASMLVCLIARKRSSLYTGALTLAVPVAAMLLACRELLWDPQMLVFCILPLSVVAVCGITAGSKKASGLAASACVVAVLVLAMAGSSDPRVSARTPTRPGEDESYTWLPKIEGHVRAKSEYAKVFVCGYDGFRLLYHARSDVFTHALDFSFEQAEEDYRGHDLFVLVHCPDGLAGMESVHRRYPDLYVYGHGPTQGAGFWGNWRLFQIIRAPRREKR